MTQKQNSSYWSKQYKIRKLKAVEYKGGKCIKCGYSKCVAALEFHHRDPKEKEVQWNQLRKRSWDTIVEELDKCDLLCSNCHREEHFDEDIWDAVEEWRREVDSRLEPKECGKCGEIFTPNRESRLYCSTDCAAAAKTKVEWPDNLSELVAQSSKSAVARLLGISNKAVEKRLKKHHNPL